MRPLTPELVRSRFERLRKRLLQARLSAGDLSPVIAQVETFYCDGCGTPGNVNDLSGWVCRDDFAGGWEDYCPACRGDA
jgi:hypothetical protein